MICPYCSQKNSHYAEDGYTNENPREYHADCWDALMTDVMTMGVEDARTHQEDFPGHDHDENEDWAILAWSLNAAILAAKLTPDAAEAMWPVYQRALGAIRD